MPSADGQFEVTMTPGQDTDNLITAYTLAKTFFGELVATSSGHMLAATTPTEGSAGYVAMERVTGTLHGRHGSFVLQHSGTMARGVGLLEVSVVPDSGTDDLAGLTGDMAIDVSDGVHHYAFTYEFDQD